MAAQPERRRVPAEFPLEVDDPSRAHGAALGTGGADGWWMWRHRRQLRRGTEAVGPGTWRDAINVTVWFAALIAITFLGAMLLPLPQPIWYVVALVVMVRLGRWWDRRSATRDAVSGPFA